MKKKKSMLRDSLLMLLTATVVCGVVYPLLITGIAQLFFRDKANGSLIEADGVQYGSALIGQNFTDDQYLWGRMTVDNTSAYTDEDGSSLYYAGPSNLSPVGQAYQERLKERISELRAAGIGLEGEDIPADLLTGSGSGLDPGISREAAICQAERIAQSRGIEAQEVMDIIERNTEGRFLGVLGEETVNVLKVNLELDGIL